MWIQFAQTLVLFVGSVVVWLVYRSFTIGQWVQTVDHAKELKALEDRLTKAGLEMSALGTKIQRLPEELRLIFVSREVYLIELKQSEVDHKWLADEIEKIWSVIHAQRKA